MKLIGTIIDLLQEDDFYVISKEVEIAKGKYERPYTWRKVLNKIKREYHWQLRKLYK